jgi:membrane-bound lytic murein transglycosylase D
MKYWVILSLCLTVSAFGILPLPYNLETEDDGDQIETSRDPRSIEAYNELFHHSKKRELELPSFGTQERALGYQSGGFAVPQEMRARVDFWKRIYTEFTTSQALLHDSENPEIVYDVVNVERYKHSPKAMNRFLRDEKERYVQKLIKLHELQSRPAEIPADLFPLFKKFEDVRGRNRFVAAAERIRAQVGQRDKVVQGYLFGGRYFHKMMEIFAQQGLPLELTRLPLVESAFNLNARSKVGASGIWQFMRSTGKMYLKIDRYIDERNDPIAATYGAARLLRENFEVLGSWPLAVTAWNHGREGMARAMRQLASNSLPHIIRHYQSRSFGFASSNFYAEFLAMLEVERDYRKHFGKLLVDDPLEFDEVTVVDEIRFRDIAKDCGMDPRELRVYNPGLTDYAISARTHLPRGFRLRLPIEKRKECLSSRKLLSKNKWVPVATMKRRWIASAKKKNFRPVSRLIKRKPTKLARVVRLRKKS